MVIILIFFLSSSHLPPHSPFPSSSAPPAMTSPHPGASGSPSRGLWHEGTTLSGYGSAVPAQPQWLSPDALWLLEALGVPVL